MERYKDIHRGQRCFIAGLGPSLKSVPIDKINREIVFMCNRAWKCPEIRETYYVAEARTLFYDNAATIRDYNVPVVKFLPSTSRDLLPDYGKEVVWYNHDSKFYQDNEFPKFSLNPAEICHTGFNVMYTQMQIAAYMGFDEIYIVGVDFDYKEGNAKVEHAYETSGKDGYGGQKRDPNFVQKAKNAYAIANAVLNDKTTRIWNATDGGKLEAFPRIDLKEVLL